MDIQADDTLCVSPVLLLLLLRNLDFFSTSPGVLQLLLIPSFASPAFTLVTSCSTMGSRGMHKRMLTQCFLFLAAV